MLAAAWPVLLVLPLAAALAMLLAPGAAASTGTATVTVTVQSATTLSVTSCGGGGTLSIGLVPLFTTGTSPDCTVTWGSNNDTAMLRLHQADRAGQAMWRPPTGPPDGTFGGGDGIDVRSMVTDDKPYGGVAVQSDGKVVVLDESGRVARWLGDGSMLDSGWGSSGVSSPPGGGSTFRAIAVDSSDRVLIGGSTGSDMYVARLTSSGALDGSFGGTGIVTVDLQGAYDDVRSIRVLGDGRIMLIGNSNSGGGYDLGFVRLLADGTPDATYGSGGIAIADVNQAMANRYVAGDVHADGSAFATRRRTTTSRAFMVAKMQPDGTPDVGFGAGGVTAVDLPGTLDDPRDIAVLPDGSCVVVGETSDGTSLGVAVLKLTPTGGTDPGFNGIGWLELQQSATLEDVARSVIAQPDGRILVGGRIDTGGAEGMDILLLRLATDGSLDETFDDDGVKVMNAAPGVIDRLSEAGALAWASDGRLVVAGESGTAGNLDTAVYRFATERVPDYGVSGADFTNGAFGACLKGVTGAGVTATWTPHASCAASDGSHWNAVQPTGGSAGAKVAASPTAGTDNATATIVFGFRPGDSQPPGSYVAPVAFEVVAPNV